MTFVYPVALITINTVKLFIDLLDGFCPIAFYHKINDYKCCASSLPFCLVMIDLGLK